MSIVKRLVLIAWLIVTVAIIHAQTTRTEAQQIADLAREINLWRISSNREPVVYNSTLEAIAAAQADYLASLSSLPNNFHVDARGRDERQRSQDAAYQWAVYDNPLRIAITEIAAVGSIESAMQFWTGSSLHTRSALNPAYREMGIAARDLGRDTLFIIVFGGRPDVLPALADVDQGDLYLTTERSPYADAGDWIGDVVSYRLLDADQRPISDWEPWQSRVPLPAVETELFYIQYEDADNNRVTTEVTLSPVWSSLERPAVRVARAGDPTPMRTPSLTPTIDDRTPLPTRVAGFMTSTPRPTATSRVTATPRLTSTPQPSPTATLSGASVQLVYDDMHLTLVNSSGDIANLFDIQFRNGDDTFSGFAWEQFMQELNISALPANHCLQIGGFTISNQVAPLSQCRWIRSFVTISEDRFFWTRGTFEVIMNDEVVTTCAADATTCAVPLP